MKKTQWLIAGGALLLVGLIFTFGDFIPEKKTPKAVEATLPAPGMGTPITTEALLASFEGQLNVDQQARLALIKNIKTVDQASQLAVYHDLAHFWRDTLGVPDLGAWYEAEAARLEKSEKSLNFAARLFLESLQYEENTSKKQWKALQAKDLFERSLNINPDNDSARVGLGACFVFGDISANPMEGIAKIKEVLDKDSTNLYAHLTLVYGAVKSKQYDKAISRLNTVLRMAPDNAEAVLWMADLQALIGNKKKALEWYQKSIQLSSNEEMNQEIRVRIDELSK